LGQSVYFYGSTESCLVMLRKALASSFPALVIAGMMSPKFRSLSSRRLEIRTINASNPNRRTQLVHSPQRQEEIRTINASNPNVIFVGLGCPKQEKWMAAHRGRLDAVMIGVGAAFDFHSGTLHRAPLWMQQHGLEWLHRLCCEPRRLFKRYLATNTKFVIGIAKQWASIRIAHPK
jgi:N-acetylglucosaminyldiphosphoundecaprenol N-acetyl-beta-D-mannosaminyltransferase